MTGRSSWLAGGGEMGELIRAYDWSASPLGALQTWPQGLRTAVRLMLATRHPMFIFWGDQHISFYNDAFRASLGPEKHPAILGVPGQEAWDEIWDIISPQIGQVMRGEGATWHVNQLVPIFRHGAIQEVYWTYSYGPIDDEDTQSGVGGVLVVCTETTEQVLTERRVRASEARESLLVRLLQGQRETEDPREMMTAAAEALGSHLGANRVGIFEMRDDETIDFDAGVSWTDGVLEPLSGTFPAEGIGTHYLAEVRAGNSLGIDDMARDPLTADSRFGELGVRAGIGIPIMRNGRWLAGLYVNHAQVRHWTAEEIALVRYVANQTWDAVERARSRTALRAIEARFRAALEIETVGVVYFDLKSRITDANDAFLHMIGFSRQDLESGHLRWDKLTPPEWIDRTQQDFEELGATGQSAPYEKEYYRGDGSRRWGLFTGKALGNGIAVAFVLDITDRKRAEEERETFAATAAHDLKTPLTALRGQAQLMLRRSRLGRLGEGPALETGLGAIDAAVGRMVALVDEMMDAAHLRAGRTLELILAPTDLVALAADTAAEVAQGTPRHSVQVEAQEQDLIGEWDRARLRRVLGNLLGNAVKYSPLGGDVVVRVGREINEDGDWAVLSVIDDGLGIPAADLPRVFEPFHRGGNVGRIGGTGIGLYGARRIVEQHGGTISAKSAEGKGATFSVRLPLRDPND